MAWVLVKGIAIAGTGLKALGKVAHFSGILDSFSSSSKNVTLFKLGDWIRLKVGGESYVTKKKTLNRIPSTLFSHLIEADKLIDIPKIQMLKLRLLNQMHITVTPSTGKIKFGKIPKKDKDKEKAKEEEEREKEEAEDDKEAQKKMKEKEKKGNAEDGKDVEKTEDAKEAKDEDKADSSEKITHEEHRQEREQAAKDHKEKFEKDQDGFWMIDRDPKHFPAILNYLRTGIITTEEADMDELLVEAQFYQIQPLIDYIKHTLLEIRRKKERKAVLEHDLKGFDKDSPYFVVSYQWLEMWKDFIYNQGKPPPAIDNSPLVDTERRPLKSKQEGEHFVFVNSGVWMTWWLIYGGGPIIARSSPNLYSNNVLSTLWHMTVGKGNGDYVCEPEEHHENEKPAGKGEKTSGEHKETKTENNKKGESKAKQDKVPEASEITHDSKIIEETEKLQATNTPSYEKNVPKKEK